MYRNNSHCKIQNKQQLLNDRFVSIPIHVEQLKENFSKKLTFGGGEDKYILSSIFFLYLCNNILQKNGLGIQIRKYIIKYIGKLFGLIYIYSKTIQHNYLVECF